MQVYKSILITDSWSVRAESASVHLFSDYCKIYIHQCQNWKTSSQPYLFPVVSVFLTCTSPGNPSVSGCTQSWPKNKNKVQLISYIKVRYKNQTIFKMEISINNSEHRCSVSGITLGFRVPEVLESLNHMPSFWEQKPRKNPLLVQLINLFGNLQRHNSLGVI